MSRRVFDAELGTFRRSWWGLFTWRGSLDLLPHGPVDASLPGSWFRPNADALSLLRELPGRYPDLRASIEIQLMDRLLDHRSRSEGGPEEIEGGDQVVSTGQVWDHVRVDAVSIETIDGALTVEVAYEVDWDQDHRLGAWIRNWQLIELNGSV